MRLTLPVPPSKNAAHRSLVGATKDLLFDAVDAYRAAESPGRAEWNAILGALHVNVAKTADYVEYEAEVRRIMADAQVREIAGPVRIEVTVHFKDRRRDAPNVLDVLLDVLEGGFYANDKAIHDLHLRLGEVSKHDPRVELVVEPLNPGLGL